MRRTHPVPSACPLPDGAKEAGKALFNNGQAYQVSKIQDILLTMNKD